MLIQLINKNLLHIFETKLEFVLSCNSSTYCYCYNYYYYHYYQYYYYISSELCDIMIVVRWQDRTVNRHCCGYEQRLP
jgi:hypothetical protein